MNNINRVFGTLVKDGRKALMPFITPGVVDMAKTKDLILSLEDNNADIIELGIPYSDPVADGPVIQKASQIALNKGINTDTLFELVGNIRHSSSIPVVFLVYYNCIFKYGARRFVDACMQTGIDGLVIPDLPYEERCELSSITQNTSIDIISLIAPTSSSRLERILEGSRGFIYCVSNTGVTGETNQFSSNLTDILGSIGSITNVPRMVGFGVSKGEQIAHLKEHCEGFIVGSAFLERLMDEGEASAISLMKDLRFALDK